MDNRKHYSNIKTNMNYMKNILFTCTFNLLTFTTIFTTIK